MLRKIELTPAAKPSLLRRYGLSIAFILITITIIVVAWQPIKNSINVNKKTETTTTISSESTKKQSEPVESEGNDSGREINPQAGENSEDSATEPTDVAEVVVNEYIFSSGDSLAKVLESFDISLGEVLALTKNYPNLEKNLRPGQLISWVTNDDGNLQSLAWTMSRRETRIYERLEDGIFEETVEMTQGDWRPVVIHGEIGLDGNSTFIGSAQAAGLSVTERYNAARFLEFQVSFKSLRQGDKFSIMVEREFVNNEHVSSRLMAAKIRIRSQDKYAIYFEKYRGYYDESGRPLAEGFLRYPWPADKKYRISSHFNPTRLHPVTKRVAPHNGVDFAVATGTPIASVGDGEVMIARYSNTAGNYVAIQHGRQFATRYMHMSKLAVKAGQIVKRGDIIGYSGNTGRSTGPHLHYEFHINNRPVNPLKVELPRPEGLSGHDLEEFKSYAGMVRDKLDALPETALSVAIQNTAIAKVLSPEQVVILENIVANVTKSVVSQPTSATSVSKATNSEATNSVSKATNSEATNSVSKITNSEATNSVSKATNSEATNSVSKITNSEATNSVSKATNSEATNSVSKITNSEATNTVSKATNSEATNSVSKATNSEATNSVSKATNSVSETNKETAAENNETSAQPTSVGSIESSQPVEEIATTATSAAASKVASAAIAEKVNNENQNNKATQTKAPVNSNNK